MPHKLKLLITSAFIAALPARAALLHLPENFNPATARVLVVIHGCLQSPESMALGTGWDQIADRENLVVFYPHVPSDHPLGCWAWYRAENQSADRGELKSVMDEIDVAIAKLGLRRPEIFLAGISSGGATVAGLMACFPRRFTAAAIHSAPSYGLVQNELNDDGVLRSDPGHRPNLGPCQPADYQGDVIVIQGTADPVVELNHASRVIRDFIGTSPQTASRSASGGGLAYRVDEYASGARRGRLIMVQGLGHAWGGFAENLRFKEIVGPTKRNATHVPFFTDAGPSSTNLIWDFFRHMP